MHTALPYHRGLDALRFYSVTAVFLFHYYNIQSVPVDHPMLYAWFHAFRCAGYLGVDFFFTLSGFLITSILISGPVFGLGSFYLRRALRIMPLYLLLVVVAFLVLPLVLHHVPSLPPLAPVLTFTANYFYAWHGDHYLFAVTLLWSISVEMQFYLVWGAVLRFARQYLVVLGIILIVASWLVKYLLYSKCSLYYITETYIPDFMIGAIGAKLIADKIMDFNNIHKAVKATIYIAAVAVFICIPYLSVFFWWAIWCNTIYALLMFGIIADQCSENKLIDLGRNKVITHLGQVSYGMYCLQGIILPFYAMAILPSLGALPYWILILIVPAVLFAVTGLAASLSYRYFESYFLRLKARL